MAKKTAIEKTSPQPGGLMKWDEELAKHAAQVADQEITPSGQFLSVRGGQMQYAGQPVKNNQTDVIVLDFIYENVYYKDKFDPDSPQPPDCYAFGREEKDLKPHAEAPHPQSETCAKCPMNAWGSADTGKGKACKNIRRLAVLSAQGLTAANVGDAEPVFVKVSVMSVKGWALYVKGLNAVFQKPPFAMVTKLGVVPDPKSQFRWTFEPVQPLGNDLIPAVFQRWQEFTKSNAIMFPYPKAAEAEAPAPKPTGKKKYQ